MKLLKGENGLKTVFEMQARLHQCFVDGGDSAHQDLLPEMSMRSHLQESYRDSEKHADVGDSLSHANNDNNEQPQHQIDSKAESDLHKVAPYELTSQERETAISRYKEKKKTRRYYFNTLSLLGSMAVTSTVEKFVVWFCLKTFEVQMFLYGTYILNLLSNPIGSTF